MEWIPYLTDLAACARATGGPVSGVVAGGPRMKPISYHEGADTGTDVLEPAGIDAFTPSTRFSRRGWPWL